MKSQRRLWGVLGALLTLALLAVASLPSAASAKEQGVPLPPMEVAKTAKVQTDQGQRLVGRMAPNTEARKVKRFRSGTDVRIVCQTEGTTLQGKFGTTNIWNLVAISKRRGVYVTSAYVDTGSNGRTLAACPDGTAQAAVASIGPVKVACRLWSACKKAAQKVVERVGGVIKGKGRKSGKPRKELERGQIDKLIRAQRERKAEFDRAVRRAAASLRGIRRQLDAVERQARKGKMKAGELARRQQARLSRVWPTISFEAQVCLWTDYVTGQGEKLFRLAGDGELTREEFGIYIWDLYQVMLPVNGAAANYINGYGDSLSFPIKMQADLGDAAWFTFNCGVGVGIAQGLSKTSKLLMPLFGLLGSFKRGD